MRNSDLISLPENCFLKEGNLIKSKYGSDFSEDAICCNSNSAVLCPKNEYNDAINDIIAKIIGEERDTYT